MVNPTENYQKIYILKLGFGDGKNSVNTELPFKSETERDVKFNQLKKELGKPFTDDKLATSMNLIFILKSEGYAMKTQEETQ